MKLRFCTSVSTTDRGYFHEGRVVDIDPSAPDFPLFQAWIRSGAVEVIRQSPERAIAPAAVEHAIARRAPSSPRGRARRTKGADADDAHGPVVPAMCPGGTVVCLASGPSLSEADVEACRGKATVIAVNDTWRLAPWADALYSSDQRWYEHYRGVPEFAGRKFGIQPLAPPEDWGITVLRNTGHEGLELDPAGLRTGRNSGAAAVNLAVLFGAARIILLGYDMGPTNGKAHFFGHHPKALRATSPFATFIAMFQTMVEPLAAIGVQVVNCSRETALDVFPRRPLEEALGC